MSAFPASRVADFTIIGAGPVGTLMALLLARRGASVQLIERRADPRAREAERGRSINLALAARGLLALDEAALIGRIAPHWVRMAGRMLHLEATPHVEAASRVEAAPHVETALRFLPYGNRESEALYSIGREQLNRLLIECAAEHAAIELRFDARCTDVDPQHRRVQLSDAAGREHSLPFRVLLGADGAGSAVRAALQRRGLTRWHEESIAHDYLELLIPARTARPGGPGGDGLYAFEPQALHIWPRGNYMLIALPNVDGSFTATLFLAREGEPSFQGLRDAERVREFFARQFADAAARIPDLARQFAAHRQGRLATVRCERWHVGGAVLLLGDAAHAIVPFHGQGLNCGFEDCRLLDRLLAAHPDSESSESAFGQFERSRQPDVAAIAAMALENYVEMRSGVRSVQFAAQAALAAELERAFPERFIPRYSLVMFHPEVGYAQARERGERTQQLLTALMERCGPGPLEGVRLACARELLDRSGL